jgi:2-methylisocitrate lyase-like PEP mutase family enzyme
MTASEDTALPLAFGQDDEAAMISTAEAAGKLRAAVAPRRDPSLVSA